ncbi:MAG: nucleotidyltransferase family protein [Bacteroidetes bacterium]|nr:nucleotidyltransferase family protein [Bacteroidota bacterium]
MKAMILAAGKGERLRPLTDTTPKALVTIRGIPLIEIILRRLKLEGFTDIIINVHHFADQILRFLAMNDNFGLNIRVSDERDNLLDTGGALIKASAFIDDNEPLLIHNVDVLSDINLKGLYEHHRHSGALVTLTVKERASARYFLFDSENRLCGWKNVATGETRWTGEPQKQYTAMAFSGIHVIGPEFFANTHLSQCFPVHEQRFSIIDVYLCLATQHKILGHDPGHALWFDLGRPEDIQKAEQFVSELKLW